MRLEEIYSGAKRFVPGKRRVFADASSVRSIELICEEDVRADEPTVRVYRSLKLIPLLRMGKGSFVGGAYLDGSFLPELGWFRGRSGKMALISSVPDPHEFQYCDSVSEAWFGGVLIWHFGHFLIESLARLVNPVIQESDLPILFFAQRMTEPIAGYMREALSLIGIDYRRIYIISKPIFVEKLHAQDPYVSINGHLCRPHRLPICGVNLSPIRRDGLLYLSRSKVLGRRPVQNEEILEETILKFGGEIFHPQEHSLNAQIDRISKCGLVVAIEGSALHSLILQRSAVESLCISRGTPLLTYFLLDEIVEGDSSYLLLPSTSSAAQTRGNLCIDDRDGGLLESWLQENFAA